MAVPPRTKIHFNSDRAKRIFRELERLDKLQFAVAIKGEYVTAKRRISVAQIAAYHEFGTSKMPSRPFIRESQRQSNEVREVFQTETKSIIDSNRRAETAARRVAKKMAELVVIAIERAPNWAIPLSPITVAKKGHSVPLLETGLLKRSIYWRVSRGGQIKEEGQFSK